MLAPPLKLLGGLPPPPCPPSSYAYHFDFEISRVVFYFLREIMFRIGLPCIVLSCAALFVTIVALTIPYWICLTPTGASAIYRSSELAYKNTYIGLWQFCYYLKTGPPSYNLSPTRSLQSTAFLCTPVGVSKYDFLKLFTRYTHTEL